MPAGPVGLLLEHFVTEIFREPTPRNTNPAYSAISLRWSKKKNISGHHFSRMFHLNRLRETNVIPEINVGPAAPGVVIAGEISIVGQSARTVGYQVNEYRRTS